MTRSSAWSSIQLIPGSPLQISRITSSSGTGNTDRSFWFSLHLLSTCPGRKKEKPASFILLLSVSSPLSCFENSHFCLKPVLFLQLHTVSSSRLWSDASEHPNDQFPPFLSGNPHSFARFYVMLLKSMAGRLWAQCWRCRCQTISWCQIAEACRRRTWYVLCNFLVLPQ